MSCREVTSLRKNGRLNEAYKLALQELNNEQNEWTLSAMFWVLNDCCKIYIENKDQEKLNSVLIKMQGLLELMRDEEKYAKKALDSLRRRSNAEYNNLCEAIKLSKQGENEKALAIFQKYTQEYGGVDNAFHEAYAWIIYRYLSASLSVISSVEARSLLRDYIALNNERPSQLHSLFINLAAKVSDCFPDFKLLPFIKLWNVSNFTVDDRSTKELDDKSIKPLTVRLIQRLVKAGIGVDDILTTFEGSGMTNVDVLEAIRESYYWNIYNLSKTNDSSLWRAYSNYVSAFGKYPASIHHSQILMSALWSMQGENEYRFLSFFSQWNWNNLMEADWEPRYKDGDEFEPLALKCVSKLFRVLKARRFDESANYLPLFEKAAERFTSNGQLKRKYALLLSVNDRKEKACELYKELVVVLDEWYVWYEFSRLVKDAELKLSLLSKALLLPSTEDLIGEVRLAAAACLLDMQREKDAATELYLYKKGKEDKGRSVSSLCLKLEKVLNVNERNKNNIALYTQYATLCESYVYSKVVPTVMILIAVYLNAAGKSRYKLIDADGEIMTTTSAGRFRFLKGASEGDVFECRLHRDVADETKIHLLTMVPLKTDKWAACKTRIVVVDGVNDVKKLFHVVSAKGFLSEVVYYDKTSLRPQKGDFLQAFYYPTKDKMGRRRMVIAHLEKTDEVDSALLKEVERPLVMNAKKRS